MKTLYSQRSETRYDNNEYADMPSLDYWGDSVELRKNNMHLVDWQEVGRICKEHGFGYAVMHGTYRNSSKVIIYERVDIDPDAYHTMLKAKAYDVCREMVKKAAPRYRELHDCVHELDLCTNLMFETGWCGNCGVFGSRDVRRRTYSFGNSVTSWESFIDRFSHYCYDTTNRPRKGVYLYMETDTAKIDTAYVFPDFTMERALEIAQELFPNEEIELQTGKRQCDGDCEPYQAIVVGKGIDQVGSLTFSQSKHGVVTMGFRALLAGGTSYKVKRDRLRECIKDAIEFMLN